MAAGTFIFPNTSQKSLLYPWHPEPLHVPVVQHVPTMGELQMLQDPYGSVPAFQELSLGGSSQLVTG